MTWKSVLGRIVYASYPFVLVGALIFAGAFSLNFTTESTQTHDWYDSVIALDPEETYVHNVTISYEPMSGYGSGVENGSIAMEEPPLANTLTNWKRAWLPFFFELNETIGTEAVINRSLVGPEGVIESWAEVGIVAGGGGDMVKPEVTQGGTYRFSLQNMGSQAIHLRFTWELEWHYYEKPYFYYGVTALAIALVYPAMFLIKNFGPWKSRQQTDEESAVGYSENG